MQQPFYPHEFLQKMAVPEHQGVYVLGSFAKHVTIYSQQVRAINLVDSLCRTGQLTEGKRVAIVGGGIAGVTVAAAALVRGARVTVIEQAQDFMPIQSNASERYLHPHIYDWPLTPGNESAGLPLLDWEAGDASSVFEKLREAWRELSAGFEVYTALMGTRFEGVAFKITSETWGRLLYGGGRPSDRCRRFWAGVVSKRPSSLLGQFAAGCYPGQKTPVAGLRRR